MLSVVWGDPDTVDEWFTEPWRDGRNATELCRVLGGMTTPAMDGTPLSLSSKEAEVWLQCFHTPGEGNAYPPRSFFTTRDYDRAEALRYLMARSDRPNDVFFEAGLAIASNWIANSDGGGHVPNVHLARALWARLYEGVHEEVVQETVGQYRAQDLGLQWHDPNTQAQAFRWLWLNQRYRLALTLER